MPCASRHLDPFRSECWPTTALPATTSLNRLGSPVANCLRSLVNSPLFWNLAGRMRLIPHLLLLPLAEVRRNEPLGVDLNGRGSPLGPLAFAENIHVLFS